MTANLAEGWNDPSGEFGRATRAKSGVVPAHFCVLPAPKFLVAQDQPLSAQDIRVAAEVTRTVTYTLIHVFHAASLVQQL